MSKQARREEVKAKATTAKPASKPASKPAVKPAAKTTLATKSTKSTKPASKPAGSKLTMVKLNSLIEKLDSRVSSLESEQPTEPIRVLREDDVYSASDGPRKMWQWWDPMSRLWRGPSESITTALGAAGGDATQVRAVAVWVKDGVVDHLLDAEEIEKYLP